MKTIVDTKLSVRYGYKLAAQILSGGVALLTSSIAIRFLGPGRFGNYVFLTAFFTSTLDFFDSGTSLGFYTKLSQRPDDSGLVQFYWLFTAGIATLLSAVIGLCAILGIHQYIWPQQNVIFVALAMAWGLLTWFSQTVNKVMDAHGLTVGAERMRVCQKLLSLLMLGALVYWTSPSLGAYFAYQYCIIGLMVGSWWYVLKRHHIPLFPRSGMDVQRAKHYGAEFMAYSLPIATYSLLAAGAGIADRWLLQRFGGDIQQAFFGLSQQVSAIAVLFTSAMVPLFMREVSRAWAAADKDKLRDMFESHLPLFYSIAVFFAAFICVQAGRAVAILGGAQFANSAGTLSLMALYPIHQVYGQLCGAVFFATGKTRAYRNIGIIVTILGLFATVLLLGPKGYGLHLGARGLAIKMVVVQLFSVNLMLFICTRTIDVSFLKMLAHQCWSFVLIISCSLLASLSATAVASSNWAVLLASAAIYGVLFIGLVFCIPQLIGVGRSTLMEHFDRVKVATNRLILRESA